MTESIHSDWIRSVEGHSPDLDQAAFVAPGAVVVGRVRVGRGTSIWYHCVLRGDTEDIIVGEGCNIQDGSILHADPGDPTILGDRVSLGHGALVHGARIEDDVLVGMRAVVLNGAHIGTRSLIAANAVVTPGTQVPADSFVLGVPARVRPLTDPAVAAMIESTATEYARLAGVHVGVWS